jgi:hypothetical protein
MDCSDVHVVAVHTLLRYTFPQFFPVILHCILIARRGMERNILLLSCVHPSLCSMVHYESEGADRFYLIINEKYNRISFDNTHFFSLRQQNNAF